MGPVEECCKFLCAFAQTSRQNQSVLFEHIPYLLNQCIEHAGKFMLIIIIPFVCTCYTRSFSR